MNDKIAFCSICKDAPATTIYMGKIPLCEKCFTMKIKPAPKDPDDDLEDYVARKESVLAAPFLKAVRKSDLEADDLVKCEGCGWIFRAGSGGTQWNLSACEYLSCPKCDCEAIVRHVSQPSVLMPFMGSGLGDLMRKTLPRNIAELYDREHGKGAFVKWAKEISSMPGSLRVEEPPYKEGKKDDI